MGRPWLSQQPLQEVFPLPGEDGRPVARMPGNVLYMTAGGLAEYDSQAEAGEGKC